MRRSHKRRGHSKPFYRSESLVGNERFGRCLDTTLRFSSYSFSNIRTLISWGWRTTPVFTRHIKIEDLNLYGETIGISHSQDPFVSEEEGRESGIHWDVTYGEEAVWGVE